MKIIIVFSSPSLATAEYQNLWCCCPQKQEIDDGQLMIEGSGWKTFVFDGSNERYWDVMWKIDVIEQEVIETKKQYKDSSIAILFHGNGTILNTLNQKLALLPNSKIMYVSYSSSRGTFYEENLKAFASDASDHNFEIVWKALEEIQSENTRQITIAQEIRSLKHNSSNIADWMRAKIHNSKGDRTILKEFNNFIRHIEEMQNTHKKIKHSSNEVTHFNIEQVEKLMTDVIFKINQMQKDEINPEVVFDSANSCLKKTEEVHSIFQKMWEDING